MKQISYTQVLNSYRQSKDYLSQQIVKALNFDYKPSLHKQNDYLAFIPVYRNKHEEAQINLAFTQLLKPINLYLDDIESVLIQDAEYFPLANSLICQTEQFTKINRDDKQYQYEVQILTHCPTTYLHADETYFTTLLPLKNTPCILKDSAQRIKDYKSRNINTLSDINDELDLLNLEDVEKQHMKLGDAVIFKSGKKLTNMLEIDENAVLHASPLCDNTLDIENSRKVLSIIIVDKKIEDAYDLLN